MFSIISAILKSAPWEKEMVTSTNHVSNIPQFDWLFWGRLVLAVTSNSLASRALWAGKSWTRFSKYYHHIRCVTPRSRGFCCMRVWRIYFGQWIEVERQIVFNFLSRHFVQSVMASEASPLRVSYIIFLCSYGVLAVLPVKITVIDKKFCPTSKAYLISILLGSSYNSPQTVFILRINWLRLLVFLFERKTKFQD